ncbi:MAG: DUF4124 domain-containing protein [Thiohalocapsa sp.]|nr:DUF4124 domain-containing protein [Thiohalocapsa sp.]MCF7990227.1 DUF4124 domain-containing protein [Thiohalocapsa sp.]
MQTSSLAMIALLLLPSLISAQVYKGTGPDGTTIYSDRPLSNAEVLEVSPSGDRAEMAEPSIDADSGLYSEFAIAAPADQTILRTPDATLELSLSLQPALRPDHRLVLLVDGVAVPGDVGQGTQMRLSGLTLGTRRLQARILDEAGTVVAQSAVVEVHVRPAVGDALLP